jgi:hypothetical protein
MRARYILLCEDEQTACFIRRFLKKKGTKMREIRELISPSGKSSGEQWVRENYPNQLHAFRKQVDATLIVGTDADTLTVPERIKTLDDACRKAGVQIRNATERVVMVVPRRNIETWFEYLRGQPVDETNCYQKYSSESDCRGDVATLSNICSRGALDRSAPCSLRLACLEYANSEKNRK